MTRPRVTRLLRRANEYPYRSDAGPGRDVEHWCPKPILRAVGPIVVNRRPIGPAQQDADGAVEANARRSM